MVDVRFRILFLLILLSSFSWAVKPPEFISYASGIIFDDCKGKDIYLNQNLTYLPTNQSFDRVPWPYDQNLVTAVFSFLSTEEPFAECVDSTCMSLGNSKIGISLLRCGNNTLDASRYDYLWNKQRIEQPSTLINYAPNNAGNLVQGNTVCNINQEQIKQSEIYLNSTKQELNNCTINLTQIETNYKNYKNDVGVFAFIYNIILAILASALYDFWKTRQKPLKTRLLDLVIRLLVVLSLCTVITTYLGFTKLS